MERRLFKRDNISINGELTWVTKGRLGRKTKGHAFVRTSNLSLDGARLDMAGNFPFSLGAIVQLTLGIHPCGVQIKDVSHRSGRTILRVSFLSPSTDFVSVLEEHLPIDTTARRHYEGKWL